MTNDSTSNDSFSPQIKALLHTLAESGPVDDNTAAKIADLLVQLTETIKEKDRAHPGGAETIHPPALLGLLGKGIAQVTALLAVAKSERRAHPVLSKMIAKLAESLAAAESAEGTTVGDETLFATASAALDEAMAVLRALSVDTDYLYPDEIDEEWEASLASASVLCEEVRELALGDLFKLHPWSDWYDREGEYERKCVHAAFDLTHRLCGPRFAVGQYGEREAKFDADAVGLLVTPFVCSLRGSEQVVGKECVSSADLAAMLARVGSTLASNANEGDLARVLAALAVDA